jgi:hypothetical protein
MPTCSKCHPVYDLGRICPHQGPGRDVWQQGWDTGYVEGISAAHLGFAEPPPERRILRDLIAELRDHCREPSCGCDIGRAADYAETRLRLSRDD